MELAIYIFGIVLRCIRFFLVPVLSLIYRKQTNRIPAIKNDLLRLSATDLAERIRNREVTSEAIVQLYIERIREVNPIVNAVNDDRFNEALVEAKAADNLVLKSNRDELAENRPFLGVPFSVKESVGLKGLQFAVGSLDRVGEIAENDGESIRLLRAAGAIPMCVTNNPEWCVSFESYNFINGRTLNPYDLSRTPGGSSGGEGALVGSGASIFGIGSDIAGSIRIPSMFCGIFGHKATATVISIEGHFPNSRDKNFKNYLGVGPLARYAKDLKPLLRVLSDGNPKLQLDKPVSIKDLKIYYKYKIDGPRGSVISVDESINDTLTKALDYFQGKVVSVQEAQIDLSKVHNIGIALLAAMDEDVPELISYRKTVPDSVPWEILKSIFSLSRYTFAALAVSGMQEIGKGFPPKAIAALTKRYHKLKADFIELLGEDGVFFFPTFGAPAFKHYESLTLFSLVAYSQIFSMLGFPATHVPLGLNKDGLPVGFQVVAAPYQDRLCLAVACELEKAFGGWVPPYSE